VLYFSLKEGIYTKNAKTAVQRCGFCNKKEERKNEKEEKSMNHLSIS
jgi:hypothetical protein